MAKNKKHTGHYLSLAVIFAFGFLGIELAYPSRKNQTEIVILIAFFYIIWGLVHQHQNHGLNSKIVIEYILIAALGIAALLFFTMGAFGI